MPRSTFQLHFPALILGTKPMKPGQHEFISPGQEATITGHKSGVSFTIVPLNGVVELICDGEETT